MWDTSGRQCQTPSAGPPSPRRPSCLRFFVGAAVPFANAAANAWAFSCSYRSDRMANTCSLSFFEPSKLPIMGGGGGAMGAASARSANPPLRTQPQQRGHQATGCSYRARDSSLPYKQGKEHNEHVPACRTARHALHKGNRFSSGCWGRGHGWRKCTPGPALHVGLPAGARGLAVRRRPACFHQRPIYCRANMCGARLHPARG